MSDADGIKRAKCCRYCMYYEMEKEGFYFGGCSLKELAVEPTEVCDKYTYRTESGNYVE